jgi:RND family efflux transporter MFP subunit
MRDQFADLERLEKSGKITREERLAREISLDSQALKEGKFRVEIAAARSGVSVARADLERARLNLERTEIRAPFDGVVTGLTLSPGEQLMVNQVLFTLVDNVNIEAEVGVLEADVGKIASGGAAILAIPALGDTIPATVDVVSPQFNRESRTCQVLMRLKNEGGRMRPGMFARALIAGERFEDRLLVPREAVLTRDGRPGCSRSKAIAPSGSTSSWVRATTTRSKSRVSCKAAHSTPATASWCPTTSHWRTTPRDQGAQDGEGGRSVGQFGAG